MFRLNGVVLLARVQNRRRRRCQFDARRQSDVEGLSSELGEEASGPERLFLREVARLAALKRAVRLVEDAPEQKAKVVDDLLRDGGDMLVREGFGEDGRRSEEVAEGADAADETTQHPARANVDLGRSLDRRRVTDASGGERSVLDRLVEEEEVERTHKVRRQLGESTRVSKRNVPCLKETNEPDLVEGTGFAGRGSSRGWRRWRGTGRC